MICNTNKLQNKHEDKLIVVTVVVVSYSVDKVPYRQFNELINFIKQSIVK